MSIKIYDRYPVRFAGLLGISAALFTGSTTRLELGVSESGGVPLETVDITIQSIEIARDQGSEDFMLDFKGSTELGEVYGQLHFIGERFLVGTISIERVFRVARRRITLSSNLDDDRPFRPLGRSNT